MRQECEYSFVDVGIHTHLLSALLNADALLAHLFTATISSRSPAHFVLRTQRRVYRQKLPRDELIAFGSSSNDSQGTEHKLNIYITEVVLCDCGVQCALQ